jgi:hypothetical protein
MPQPSQTQTGAFFGIVASALILVLTAMALLSTDGRTHHQSARYETMEATPVSYSLPFAQAGGVAR